MLQLLKILGLPGVLIVFFSLIVLSIALVKLFFRYEKKHVLIHHPESKVLVKKYTEVDEAAYKPLIFRVALIITLLFTISLFEFPVYEEATLVQLTSDREIVDEMYEIPPTEQKQPPPPKVKSPQIVEVADEKEIEYEIEIDLDMEADEETVIEEAQEIAIEEMAEEEEEKTEEIFMIVEEPAEPVGGYKEFYAYVSENLKYPRKALEVSVSGKVYIKFIVDKDGSLTNLEVARGIGYGCDEEAIKVLQNAPKWKPGRQRGRNVKQQMIIPIVFKMAEM
ncbi:energy transducer TonB [Chondrinema litorale]|uniref:energy transducer TonB n=1 Tax=Chondrinema litorale TaxID=2994555 RepID=UPI002543E901|nr:energy transducer TonB [Chondrinema litorale]UZR95659.1 energy transducer TonB [Chondrinema litorale]